MKKCVFIGYEDGIKGWRFYNPTTKRTLLSECTDFDEHYFPGLKQLTAPLASPPSSNSAPPPPFDADPPPSPPPPPPPAVPAPLPVIDAVPVSVVAPVPHPEGELSDPAPPEPDPVQDVPANAPPVAEPVPEPSVDDLPIALRCECRAKRPVRDWSIPWHPYACPASRIPAPEPAPAPAPVPVPPPPIPPRSPSIATEW